MGAILFEMLTGQRAFQGESFGEIAHAVLHGTPPALSGPPAIAAMGRIVHRALARESQHRYPNAKAMAEELRAGGKRLPDGALSCFLGESVQPQPHTHPPCARTAQAELPPEVVAERAGDEEQRLAVLEGRF